MHVTVPYQRNRNGKRRRNINLSPCKQPQLSAICRLEQPARRGWRPRRMLCEEGVESQPEPIIPPCLLCPPTAWISRGAHPAGMYSFVRLGVRDRWYTNHCPLPHPPRIRASPFGRYGVIRLKVDVCTRCISASSWVTIFDHMLLTFG